MLGREKRKFTRLKTHHLLKYKIVEKEEINRLMSFVRDISAGGLLFYTEEHIPPKSIVELEVNFPAYAHPIKVIARVVRVTPLKKVGGFEVGVEFIDIEENARHFVNRKILRVYDKIKMKGGSPMKTVAMSFLGIAAIIALVGLIVKLTSGAVFPSTPASWMRITQTCLLFSVAASLLMAQK